MGRAPTGPPPARRGLQRRGLRAEVGTHGWDSDQPRLAQHPQALGHPALVSFAAARGAGQARVGGRRWVLAFAAPSFLEQLTLPLAGGCRELGKPPTSSGGPCSMAQPGNQGSLAPAALSPHRAPPRCAHTAHAPASCSRCWGQRLGRPTHHVSLPRLCPEVALARGTPVLSQRTQDTPSSLPALSSCTPFLLGLRPDRTLSCWDPRLAPGPLLIRPHSGISTSTKSPLFSQNSQTHSWNTFGVVLSPTSPHLALHLPPSKSTPPPPYPLGPPWAPRACRPLPPYSSSSGPRPGPHGMAQGCGPGNGVWGREDPG